MWHGTDEEAGRIFGRRPAGRPCTVCAVGMDSTGAAPVAKGSAAVVGHGFLPPSAQGVAVDGSRTFGAFVARVIGFTDFTSSATATAVAGALSGGAFLPVVFPINIVDCDNNGSLGSTEVSGGWIRSQPPAAPGARPNGPEYIVPLCKTGTGNFQILDFDSSLKCNEEIEQGTQVSLNLPQYVDSDQGNDCAKKIVDAVNSLHGKVVNVPICDNGPDAQHPIGNCDTAGGGNAQYHIVKVASFWVDYMDDSNNQNKPSSARSRSRSSSTATAPAAVSSATSSGTSPPARSAIRRPTRTTTRSGSSSSSSPPARPPDRGPGAAPARARLS